MADITVTELIRPAAQSAAGSQSALKAQVKRFAQHCWNYRTPDTRRAAIQIGNTLIPYVILMGVMLWVADSMWWLTLLLAIPASGLLVRLFIIQHDCGHGSFLPTQTANNAVGAVMSVLTATPYMFWRRMHNMHHAGSGNLDRRGFGDITTLTVAEYKALSPVGKLGYRIYRNVPFLLLVGAPLHFLILQRIPFGHPMPTKDIWRSVLGLDLAMAVVYGALIYVFGWSAVLIALVPTVMMAAAMGVWLFYVQHQFETVQWDDANHWDQQVAAFYGSSYYVLPGVVNWFTGHIGLHHIHHLASSIPNYRLQECLDANPELAAVNRVTFRESLATAQLALWDAEARKLIPFRELAAR